MADLVIQMLGTDYARILRAIYAFAQVCNLLSQTIFSVSDEIVLDLNNIHVKF